MSKSKRSVCPVACALDIFGDKWTLLVIRDLACGKTLFKQFCASPEGIATNILTDRLQRLETYQLVERVANEVHAGRDAYRLTAKGKSLLPVLQNIADWGLTHIPGTAARMKLQR